MSTTWQKGIIPNGTKFGRLTVMYLSDKKLNRGRVYHCLCDCGKECDVRAMTLKSGETKSCGCLSRELTSKRNKNKFVKTDLINQRFGKLVALEPTEERKNNSVVWKCQCDCGNVCFVSRKSLMDGTKSSCGCLKSQGEERIKQLLLENNIPFEEQKSFNGLVGKKNYPLKFDFYVNNTYLIEFDGEQHFTDKSFFSHDDFETRQKNDRMKNEYCKNHNIPLIRIPYSNLKTLTIKDLLLH